MFSIAPKIVTIHLPRFIICGHTQTLAERLGWGNDENNEQRSLIWIEAVKDSLVSFGVCNMDEIALNCACSQWNGGPLQHDGVLAVRYGTWQDPKANGDWEFNNTDGEVVDKPVGNVVALVHAAAMESGAKAVQEYDRLLDEDKAKANPRTYGTAQAAEEEVDELRDILRRINHRAAAGDFVTLFEREKWTTAANFIEEAMSRLWTLAETE